MAETSRLFFSKFALLHCFSFQATLLPDSARLQRGLCSSAHASTKLPFRCASGSGVNSTNNACFGGSLILPNHCLILPLDKISGTSPWHFDVPLIRKGARRVAGTKSENEQS
jgi:hypothetical protein